MSSPPPCAGNVSLNRARPIARRDTMRFDVVAHVTHSRSAGRRNMAVIELARTPRVNRLTGAGNTVGPAYPAAPGCSRAASTYLRRRSRGARTSSSRNST